MKHWSVGLCEHKGKWFSASLDSKGRPIFELDVGRDNPNDAVEQLRLAMAANREREDWDAYFKARYLM